MAAELRETVISDSVRVYSSEKNQSNVTLIERDGVEVVIDTFLFPADNKHLSSILETGFSGLERLIINTHCHSDHCYGNRTIRNSQTKIIAHKLYAETLCSEKRMIKSGKSYHKPTIRIPTPDLIFDGNIELPKLGIKVYHTPGHSFDSSSIHLLSEDLLIVGDNSLSSYKDFYLLPYFYWGDIQDLVASLNFVLKLKPKLIVPGHGKPVTAEKIEMDLDYLQKLYKRYNNIDDREITERLSKLIVDNVFNEEELDSFIARFLSLTELLPRRELDKIGVREIHRLNIKRLLLNSREKIKGE